MHTCVCVCSWLRVCWCMRHRKETLCLMLCTRARDSIATLPTLLAATGCLPHSACLRAHIHYCLRMCAVSASAVLPLAIALMVPRLSRSEFIHSFSHMHTGCCCDRYPCSSLLCPRERLRAIVCDYRTVRWRPMCVRVCAYSV